MSNDVADAPRRASAFAAFAVPSYARLWGSGALWSLARFMALFLSSYLVTDLSGASLLVQLVGASFFAPMFFAGAVGGVISDRFDRRRTIVLQLVALIPIAALMAVLVSSGAVRVWMVYPFVLMIGLGGVLDMTSRRALIYDLVGPERITNALALESLSQSGGAMFGAFLGGAVIAVFGIGPAFALVACWCAAALGLVLGVRSPPQIRTVSGGTSMVRDLTNGFGALRRMPALVSIIGVTVLMNGFFFSYTPMVPVFANRLGVGAFQAGMLASATELGRVTGTLLIAVRDPTRRGLLYVSGSILALVCLLGLAASSWYPGALLALLLAGVCVSGFGTMQGVLVMTTATAEMRGRAMGLLSMAIGTLPFSMALLGVVAQRTSAPLAVGGSAVIGVLSMLAWNRYRPEAVRLR